MGLAMLTDVKEIKDKAILDVKTTTVTEATVKGRTRDREAPVSPLPTTARTT